MKVSTLGTLFPNVGWKSVALSWLGVQHFPFPIQRGGRRGSLETESEWFSLLLEKPLSHSCDSSHAVFQEGPPQ